MGMEGITTSSMDWGAGHATMSTRLTDWSKWMLQSLRSPAQECLINMQSKQADGLEGKLASTSSLNLMTDSSCSVTAGGEILGLGKRCLPDFFACSIFLTLNPVDVVPDKLPRSTLFLTGLFRDVCLVLFFFVISQVSGCALFAALYKEDLTYSQPMNQLTLNLSFWTWTLRNFSVLTSDWAGPWHYQLDSNPRWSCRLFDHGSHLCLTC